jgi:hypothetical protein
MLYEYMTTKEFLKTIEGIGLKADVRAETIDIFLDGHQCATVNRHKLLSFEVKTEELGSWAATRLANTVLCYANTPVSKRAPKVCKLKVYNTGLYLNSISKHEMTVTMNKKAAKTYDGTEVYNAKVLAEKQGTALVVEMANAAN